MNTLDGRALDIECYQLKFKFELNSVIFRGFINSKEGKAAALPKFLDTLTLSQPEGGRHMMSTHWLGLA